MSYYNQKSLSSMKSRATRMKQSERSIPQSSPSMAGNQTFAFDEQNDFYAPPTFNSAQGGPQYAFAPPPPPPPFNSAQGGPQYAFAPPPMPCVPPHRSTHGYSKSEVRSMEGFENDSDPEFDLGKDGAFSDFSVIVGCFYTEGSMSKEIWEGGPGQAFAQKGFNVDYILIDSKENYERYLSGLLSEDYDVAWLISDVVEQFPSYRNRLVDAVMKFHKSGRGLMIWADNDPAFVQPNYILPELCGVHLIGNNFGDRVLGYGSAFSPGEFDEEHVIFAGLNYLYEGVTICYPVMLDGSPIDDGDTPLKVLATSTDEQPCIAYMESTETTGRVIVDTGFTKLFAGDQYYGSAGQARYVINSAVYLVDVERKFGESTIVD